MMKVAFLDDPEYLRFSAQQEERQGFIVRAECVTGHVIERVGGHYEVTTPHGDKLMDLLDGTEPRAFTCFDNALYQLFGDDAMALLQDQTADTLREMFANRNEDRK